uniref:Arginine/serine-rich protein 1 n=1 Tax=Mola mola TaxID=94237 RepID=A0A3Q3W3I6_MOLML
MAKVKDLNPEMAHARQSDGINVIFDQTSPTASHTRSRSRSSSNSGRSSVSSRGRGSRRRRHRSSSSTSSSGSRSSHHSRSRSHPRCYRGSSRCRCENHSRYGRGHYRRYRARSPSHSSSPSPDRHSRRRHCRSRRLSRTHRSRSKSRSLGHSFGLSLSDKRELLQAAKANTMKVLGAEKLKLPESVKPILSEMPEASKWESPEPETRVGQDPDQTLSQVGVGEMCNNLSYMLVAPSCAKVTARVDIYESRKPYGHWVPVKSGRTSNTRRHALATLR